MSIESKDLATILAELKNKAGVTSLRASNNASFTYMRQVSKILGLYIRSITQVARGPKPYKAVEQNRLLNKGFLDDVSSWTETIDATVTATTARSNAKAFINELGGVTSLKINITASTGAGEALRSQIISSVGAGEVWSFECGALVSALAGSAKGILRVEWLNGASAVISTIAYDFSVVDASNWVKSSSAMYNLTSPALTISVRVSLILRAQAASDTGTVYFDNVIACKEPDILAFATRGIAGYSKAS